MKSYDEELTIGKSSKTGFVIPRPAQSDSLGWQTVYPQLSWIFHNDRIATGLSNGTNDSREDYRKDSMNVARE